MRIEDIQISRRALLLATGSIAALAAVAPSSLFAAAPSVPSVPVTGASPFDIRYIVTDQRYPQSLAHAEALAAQCCQTLEVSEGLTRMWQDSLLPLW